MITSLEWKESTKGDCVGVWQRNGPRLEMVTSPIRRRVWEAHLGLVSMRITERDMDYLAQVHGGEADLYGLVFGNISKKDRDVERVFITPDLEGAKRGALEYALAFLKRDLVIVCGELGVQDDFDKSFADVEAKISQGGRKRAQGPIVK
jgi:hypothetical protein